MSVKSTWRGPEVSAAWRRKGSQLALRGAHMIRNEAIRLIRESNPSGRVYVRGGVRHRASAPGQPPATDLGRLIQSIAVRHEPGSLSATVIVGAAYGRALEFGTRNMRPRPFMGPSVRNVRPQINALAVKLLGELGT